MAAKNSVLGLILLSSPFLRTAKAQFPVTSLKNQGLQLILIVIISHSLRQISYRYKKNMYLILKKVSKTQKPRHLIRDANFAMLTPDNCILPASPHGRWRVNTRTFVI